MKKSVRDYNIGWLQDNLLYNLRSLEYKFFKDSFGWQRMVENYEEVDKYAEDLIDVDIPKYQKDLIILLLDGIKFKIEDLSNDVLNDTPVDWTGTIEAIMVRKNQALRNLETTRNRCNKRLKLGLNEKGEKEEIVFNTNIETKKQSAPIAKNVSAKSVLS